MPSVPEFAEEYTRAEKLRYLVMSALAGALIVLVSEKWLFPWEREFAAAAPCREVFGIAGLRVLWYAVFVGIPLFSALGVLGTLGWRGYKILRDGQVPPAKEKGFRPTRIYRGSRARLVGYLHLFAASPFLAIAVWGRVQAEDLSVKIKPKPDACLTSESQPAASGAR